MNISFAPAVTVREQVAAARAAIEEAGRAMADAYQSLERTLDEKRAEHAEVMSRVVSRGAIEQIVDGLVRDLAPPLPFDVENLRYGADTAALTLRNLSAIQLLALFQPEALKSRIMLEADFKQERRGGWTPDDEAEAAGERALELQREMAELEHQLDRLGDEIANADFEVPGWSKAPRPAPREPGAPSVTGPGAHL
jgi:hypothetical protein